MTKNIALLLVALLISGCTAIPKINSASDVSKKEISFPPLNQKVFVVSGGIVHLKTFYVSGYKFRLMQPYQKSVQLGLANISVDAGEDFVPSVLDGEEHHCVSKNAYKDLVGFSNKNVCFYENQGKFTKIKYAPGMYWFSVDLSPPVDIIKSEVIVSKTKAYAKKELVYDGATTDGNIVIIEKEYTDSLVSPSKLRPITIRVGKLPSKVDVSGVIINILEYSTSSMTFTLDKPFE